MTSIVISDVEGVVKSWLATTPVASLVARGSSYNIYLAMPKGTPLPAVVLHRVGGAPSRTVMPTDEAVIRFHCWAEHRPTASAIAVALVGAIEGLSVSGGYAVSNCRLKTAQTLTWHFLPDPTSDTPRYLVEASFTAVSI